MSKITTEIKNLYTTHGGNPNLDGYYSTAKRGHTVFGQVFEGMDVIDKISNTPTESGDKPVEAVTINEISLEAYTKNN